jgi:hypothetical protein
MNESTKFSDGCESVHVPYSSVQHEWEYVLVIKTPLLRRIPGVPRFLHWSGRCEGVGKVNGGECSYCLKAAMKAIGEEWKA